MNAEETTAALLAILTAHRALRGHGTRRNDKRVRRAAFVEIYYQNGLPVKVYRRAGDKR